VWWGYAKETIYCGYVLQGKRYLQSKGEKLQIDAICFLFRLHISYGKISRPDPFHPLAIDPEIFPPHPAGAA